MAATGHNYSINPDSLHAKLKAWGAAQEPKMNVSNVACLAFKEFLTRRGVQLDDQPAAAEDGLLTKVKELVREVGAEAVEAKLSELTLATAERAGGAGK